MSNALTEILGALQTISKAITTTIVNLLSSAGWNIPEWVINLVLIGLVLLFFFKWYKKLPWIMLAFLGLLFASFIMGFVSNVLFG